MPANRKDFEQAVVMYNNGMSIGQIASQYGVTRQAMWSTLARRNVQFRDNKRYGEDNHFYRGTGIHKEAHDIVHDLVERAVESGKIIRKNKCEYCGFSGVYKDGRSAIQAHHCDYNKPFDLLWLCKNCHHEWHIKNRAKEVASERNGKYNSLEHTATLSSGYYQ